MAGLVLVAIFFSFFALFLFFCRWKKIYFVLVSLPAEITSLRSPTKSQMEAPKLPTKAHEGPRRPMEASSV